MITITDATFEQDVTESPIPVLVDFWAGWCGPCKMMEPVLDEIARQYDDKLIVGKMNVDDNLEMVRKFSVMSVPTLILFKEGQVLVQMVGAKNKAQLMQQLTPHL